jgi:hypothetical protein
LRQEVAARRPDAERDTPKNVNEVGGIEQVVQSLLNAHGGVVT